MADGDGSHQSPHLVGFSGDPRSAEEVNPRVKAARRRAAREKQQRLELALQELEKIRASKSGAEAQAEARASQSDPEARIMKQSDGGWAASYCREEPKWFRLSPKSLLIV